LTNIFHVESIKWENNKITGLYVSIMKKGGGIVEKKYFTLKELHDMQIQNEMKVKVKEPDPLYNKLIMLPITQRETGGKTYNMSTSLKLANNMR